MNVEITNIGIKTSKDVLAFKPITEPHAIRNKNTPVNRTRKSFKKSLVMGSSFQELGVKVGNRRSKQAPAFILQEKELPTHVQPRVRHAMLALPRVTTSMHLSGIYASTAI